MERELGSVSPPRTPLISPYDNLAAKQSHGLPLPCSVNDTSACITQEVADRIYRLGNWEYAFRSRSSSQALHYSVLRMGAWVLELKHNLLDQVKYRHK